MDRPPRCLGIDHIDLSVSDLARSRVFYDLVLTALGFQQGEDANTVFWCLNGLEIGIRAATAADTLAFDRYRTGLHHLALRADSRQSVDRLHALLKQQGVPILDAPAEYPHYGEGYYAVFFADPDGMKIEYVFRP